MEEYPRYNGVTMKPGVVVYVTDRDHGNWDYEGTIVAAYKIGNSWQFDIKFGNGSVFSLSDDQIAPSDTDTKEAREWRAARQLRVFLCHASEDKESVRQVYQELSQAGMRPWLDEEDLPPGVEWNQAIQDAVRDCHIVLVLLSKNSIDKDGYVQREIRVAVDRAEEKPEGKIYIIPAKLEECPIPRSLKKWQSVDVFSEKGRSRLISHLQSIAASLVFDD